VSTVDPNAELPSTPSPTFVSVPATATVVTVPSAPDIGSGGPRIIFNGQAIDLPVPYRFQAYPLPSRHVNVSPIGKQDTFLQPRVDIRVITAFDIDDIYFTSAERRADLHNFRQWALKGNPWALTMNSMRTVDTTLTLDADGTDTIVADTSGVLEGEIYKLTNSYYYERVTVANVSGSTITLAERVLGEYPVGSKLRDENFFPGCLRSDSRVEIVDLEAGEYQSLPQTRFRLNLDFYEDSVTVFEYEVFLPSVSADAFLLNDSDPFFLNDGDGFDLN
jgi:hypothetical protein